jgi:hypothetical protein
MREPSISSSRGVEAARTNVYNIIVFCVAGGFLLWGLLPLKNGQITTGPLFAGLLYLAFGLALRQNHPIARARFWCLAALPVAITPLGFVVLVGTAILTIRLRKTSAK